MPRPAGTPPARTLPGCHSGGPPPGAASRSPGVPPCQVRPRQGRLPASHHTRQGVMRRVEVFEHLVYRGRRHGPVGVPLCGTQPGRQGGFILRGGDRRLQAVLDGRGLGVVWEEAALRVAVGGGHRRAPRRIEETRQGQADREVAQTNHLGV